MSNKNKTILVNRLKSLGWRFLMMTIAILVNFAMVNLNLFNLPGEAVVIVGLVLGEISKYLNVDIKK